jgi:hypothetical protein
MRAIVILCVVVATACTKPNPNRCCADEADCSSKGIPVGSQCEQGLICRGNQCISEPCVDSGDCDPAAPYCVADLCGETCAEDTQCPGFGQDASQQFCVGGGCVACRNNDDCSVSAPVCDGGICRAVMRMLIVQAQSVIPTRPFASTRLASFTQPLLDR